ncbi:MULTISPECIES: hypothetical protein [Clostridia]|uniref:hypothetical protein n=1 Tax=Clostridia TaxID=186801 RepID=UPI00061F35AE|nr:MULTISPECIES: hypothetical protein [Clostridia]KJJ65597.1 beta-1,6-galactofuranosyltransferase WbbI [Clostridium sp. FS41]MCC8085766.1 hypothetical protein [Clostridium sp.]SFS23118.1 hypothetical protein SAMN05216568_1126 [Enterocloster citroniae]
MKKIKQIILEDIEEKNLTAGCKAKDDIRKILKYPVFRCYKRYFHNNIMNYLFSIPRLLLHLSNLYNAESIVLQYPFYTHPFFNKFCYSLLPRKACVLIHDVNSLRYGRNEKEIRKEIQQLNHFRTLIAHTPHMSTWMRANGVTSSIIELGIFDYVTSGKKNPQRIDYKLPYTVAFAGNLGKSIFLKQLITLSSESLVFRLYGPNAPTYLSNNADYQGAFESDELPDILQGHFGLVWDGSSLQECEDVSGNYLRYNSPHKFSLYMAAGMPVIIGSESALAAFVEQEKIGIALSDLTDLPERLAQISFDEYSEMKANTEQIRKKVQSGYYIKHALKKN